MQRWIRLIARLSKRELADEEFRLTLGMLDCSSRPAVDYHRTGLLNFSEHSVSDYMPDSFGLDLVAPETGVDFVARETDVDLDVVSSRPTLDLAETGCRVLPENSFPARLRS